MQLKSEQNFFIKSFRDPIRAIQEQSVRNSNFLSCTVYDWARFYGIEIDDKTEDQLREELLIKISKSCN